MDTFKVDTEYGDSSYDMYIYVGGDQVFSTGSQHSRTTRSIDVSSYTGETAIKLEYETSNTYDVFVGGGTGSGQALEFY